MSDTAETSRPGPQPEPGACRPRKWRRVRVALDGLPEEWFSGELVLQDLEAIGPEDGVGARAVLARFMAALYFTNELRGDWPGHLLRQQRSAALNALGAGLLLDREQRTLRAALESCDGVWRRSAVRLLLRSAAAARARSHRAGALALYRIAFEAALVRGWWAEAAGAAREIAGFASLLRAGRSGARWHRRARALARTAARAAGAA